MFFRPIFQVRVGVAGNSSVSALERRREERPRCGLLRRTPRCGTGVASLEEEKVKHCSTKIKRKLC